MGLVFAEGFLWLGAAVVVLPVLLVTGVLLLVRGMRRDPVRLAVVLSAVVALAGLVFCFVAWTTVSDSEFVRRASIAEAQALVRLGALSAVVPLLVAAPLAILRRR